MADLTDTEENPNQSASVFLGGRCQTELIADRPASREDPNDKDAFESNNPHSRVAEAISDLIRHEIGGIAIGLEGSWGAGKTTVVNLLKEQLRDNKQLALPANQTTHSRRSGIFTLFAHPIESMMGQAVTQDSANQSTTSNKAPLRQFGVVTFDAWAHEKDPLRRSFLENVIPELQALGWVDKDRWSKRLEIIGQRREEKRTESFPQLKFWGIAVGISFFLVPIGTSLLSASSKDIQFPFDFSLGVAWKFVIGLLLVTAPVLILSTLYLYSAVKSLINRVTNGPPTARTEGRKETSLWAMLFQRIITSERTETFKTPNPTSVEFESEFKALLSEALEGTIVLQGDEAENIASKQESDVLRQRHIVLVLDNLDRVDASDALSVWSTLQTFLSSSHHRPPSWANRLWTIVLYDPTGIRGLWDKEGASSERSEKDLRKQGAPRDSLDSRVAVGAPSNTGERPLQYASFERPEISSSFIDKSFRIRFEVPPPISSDWREYLLKFLRKAFPSHQNNEFYEVHSVLSTHLALAGRLPTIRELKLFVNQIGAIHRQWASDGYRSGERLKQQSSQGSKGETVVLCRFPLKDIAYFVLLKRRGTDIIDGLRGGSLPENEFTDILDDDARDTLAAMAFNVEVDKARQILLRGPIESALLTGNGTELLDLSRIHGEGFWDVLNTVVTPRWLKTDPARTLSAVEGMASSGILDKGKPPLSVTVVKSLRNAAIQISAWPSFNQQKAGGLAALWRWNSGLASTTNSDQAFTNSLLHSVALTLVEANSPGDLVTLPVQDWFEGLNIVLKEINQGQAANVDISRTVIKPLADPLLADPDGRAEQASIPRLEVILEALFRLRVLDCDASNDSLKAIGENGNILNHLHKAAVELSDHKAAAWCFFVFLRILPNAPQLPVVGGSPQGYDYLIAQFEKPHPFLVKEFIDLLAKYEELPLVFRILDENSASTPFIGMCLEVSASQDNALLLFTPEVITSRWGFIDSFGAVSTSTQEHLISKLLEESNQPLNKDQPALLASLFNQGFKKELATLYKIVASTLTSGIRGDGFQAWCLDALKKVHGNQWVEELARNGSLLGLLFAITREGEESELPNYSKAISRYAKKLINGGKGESLAKSPLFPLGEVERRTLRDAIRDMATTAEGKIGDDFFPVFGDQLADLNFLLDHGSEKAALLFLPILRNRNVSGLLWIREFLKATPEFCEPFSKHEIGRIFVRELDTPDQGIRLPVTEQILKLLQGTSQA